MSFVVTLPMPPSVNHYWRHGRNGTYISAEGKAYRAEVLRRCKSPVVLYPHQRLAVTLTLHANSRRPYDVDNRAKACLDALEKAGVYGNDGQIDRLFVLRGEVRDTAACEVRIEVIG